MVLVTTVNCGATPIVSPTYYAYNRRWHSLVSFFLSYLETLCDNALIWQHTQHVPMQDSPIR